MTENEWTRSGQELGGFIEHFTICPYNQRESNVQSTKLGSDCTLTDLVVVKRQSLSLEYAGEVVKQLPDERKLKD